MRTHTWILLGLSSTAVVAALARPSACPPAGTPMVLAASAPAAPAAPAASADAGRDGLRHGTALQAAGFGTRPSFVENRGQLARRDVILYAQCGAVDVAFCPDVVLFNHLHKEWIDDRWVHVGGDLVELRVSDDEVVPEAHEPGTALSHFLLGDDPDRWVRGARHFGRVHYADVRPGIDLDWFFGPGGELTYEFTVHPGAEPDDIAMAYRGVTGVEARGSSSVEIVASGSRMRDGELVCFQDVGGERRVVPSEFRMLGDAAYGIGLPRGFDRSRDLVVDPTIGFASYWGIGGANSRTATIDGSGNIYISGGADTPGWPTTPGAYDRTHEGNNWPDATAAKFDSNGNLVWSTLLGGPEEDYVYVSAVNVAGELHVSGRAGTGFPTTAGAFDRTFNGGTGAAGTHSAVDIFVAKLKSDGSDLLYCTYIGGNGDDNGRAIHLYPDGRLLVGGDNSKSTDMPATPGAYKTSKTGNKDGFVAEVAADGKSLGFLTYFGPGNDTADNQDETLRSLGVDDVGNIWVAGATNGTDMTPTSNAFQKVRGGPVNTQDAWVAKLSSDGSQLRYFSWLGGDAEDEVETEGVNDAAGNFYVCGSTASSNFPFTPGAVGGTTRGRGGAFAGDGYVARINADGSLGMATAVGGSTVGPESCFGPAVDAVGNVYVCARVRSFDCPVSPNAYQPNKGAGANKDAYLGVFSPDGTQLLYGTYLGGTGEEDGRFVAIHPDSSFVVITGETGSTDLPVTNNAYQATPGHAFLAKFDVSDISSPAASPGSLRFTQSAYSAGESAGTATITVERVGGSDGAVSVGWSAAAGSATAGTDFDVATGTLQFAQGVTQASFTVTLHDDAVDEPNESVLLSIQGPTGGAALSAPTSATLTIQDDDAGNPSESPLLVPSVLSLRRSAAKPARDRLTFAGVIDTGLATLDLASPVTARIGGISFDAPVAVLRRGAYRSKDADLEFVLSRSRSGSSRAVVHFTAAGDALAALDDSAPVVVEFQCGAFHAACTVQLAAGRFRDRGRTGTRLLPMSAPLALKGTVHGAGKDSLRLELALPPDANLAADVTVHVGGVTLSAPAAQFTTRRGKKTFAVRGKNAMSVVVDPARRTVLVKAKNVDFGTLTGSPVPLYVDITMGSTHGFDVLAAQRGARLSY